MAGYGAGWADEHWVDEHWADEHWADEHWTDEHWADVHGLGITMSKFLNNLIWSEQILMTVEEC